MATPKNQKLKIPTLKITGFAPKLHWDKFKQDLEEFLHKMKVEKLKKMLEESGGVFGNLEDENKRKSHLDSLFAVLEKEMEIKANKILMYAVGGCSIYQLLKEDQWRNIGFEEKMVRLESFFGALTQEIGGFYGELVRKSCLSSF